MNLAKDALKRFESKYMCGGIDDCWEWQGSKQKRGYGFFGIQENGVSRKTYSAHRLAWAIANNQDIPPGKMICHSCDNPSCVNPKHLYLGTGFDNNTDTIKRGRATRKTGSACSWAKLSEQDVKEIRASNDKQVVLAMRYGVSASHISRIKNSDRKLWACEKSLVVKIV